ncbi:hypothetical protein K413DRAFT_4765 [Clostridium sp. ASBs410]|nr:hypothetical protein K413DRAFT_4765 [Clostridium sp. ASBs410]
MSYPEYPWSNFPEEICDLPNMQDVSPSLRPIVEQYDNAWINNDTDKMAQLTLQYPNLDKSLFNAKKFNVVLDHIKSLEKFFLEKVAVMIDTVVQHTIGIKDNATGAEKKTNTYSAEKIDYMTGTIIASNITVNIADWDSNLEYKYTSNTILTDDRINIYFADASKINASKAFVYVKSNTGAGNFILKANKIPKSALVIDNVEVVRKNG